MEVIRVIPLIIFLIFCSQVAFKKIQLKRNGVLTSSFKITLKSIISTIGLLVFLVIIISELLFQAQLVSFAVLPGFFQFAVVHSSVLAALGILSLILSVVLMHSTLSSFKNSLRFGLDSTNLGKLITTGIFSHSRNPFFISILILFFGISFVFPTPFFVGVFILSLISIHLFILKEEKFMRKNYGEEYSDYTKKVRRYF